MQSITVQDTVGDNFTVEPDGSGGINIVSSDFGTQATVQFGSSQKDEVRTVRDALNEWLGDAPNAAAPIVRASAVSFNEGLLRLAAVNEKTVEFSYAKGDGNVIERRRLRPEKVEEGKDGSVRFVGYDPDRDEPRAYRVDRIKGEIEIRG